MNYLVYQIHDRKGNVYGTYNTHKEALEALKNKRIEDVCGYYKIEMVTKGESDV